jgi:hypothetical protein
MAELRLLPLNELLNTEQVEALKSELAEVGVDPFPEGDEDNVELDEGINDDMLMDFMDRLDAHDLACTIFLPVEFEGTLEIGDHSVGSSYALLDALEELREELDIDDDTFDIEDDELDMEVIEEQLRYAWRIFLQAANSSVERVMPLHINS